MSGSRLWLWHYHTLLSFRKGNLTDDCYELKPQPKPDNTPWQYCQAKKAVFPLISSHWRHITQGCVCLRVHANTVGISKGKTLIWAETDLAEMNPRSALTEIYIIWQSRHAKGIDCNYNLILQPRLKYPAGFGWRRAKQARWQHWHLPRTASPVYLHCHQDANTNDRRSPEGSDPGFGSGRIQASLNLLGLGLQILHKHVLWS